MMLIRGMLHTLMAMTVLPLAAGAQAPATPTAPAPATETSWGKAVNGVQAGIRIDNGGTRVHAGDRIKVELALRNTTDHDIDYAYGNAQRIYGWQVKQRKDGTWEIAPRWRYWHELKLEPLVAGAIGLRLAAGSETAVPMDAPEILISDRPPLKPDPNERRIKLTIVARPGSDIQLRALPITAAARGEEWLDKLETGVLKLHVAARQAGVEAAQASDGVLWGLATGGIQAGIRLESSRKTYRVGEPIWQEVYVRNRSTQPISFVQQIGFEEQGQARIVDSRGKSVHVQQYYGMGGMAMRSPREVRPGTIVQIGRHVVAFTGRQFGTDSPKEVAPGISPVADGLPMAYAPAGTYGVAQTASGTAGGKPISLSTGFAQVTIAPSGAEGNAATIALIAPARESIPDMAIAPIAWGGATNGLRAGLISVDGKSHVLAGEQVRLAVIVQNVAGRPVSFRHDTSFVNPPPVVVRDQTGRRIAVRELPETEWRPIGDLRMTGVTYDMTFAPSAGGPGRTVESEIKPGQSVLGYLLTSFVLPAKLPAGTTRLAFEQPWPVGFGPGEAINKILTTGRLDMEVIGGRPSASAPVAAQAVREELSDVRWGRSEQGLQAGIRFHEGRTPRSTGEQLWMDLYVRNTAARPQTITYQTGSVYIDPPVEVDARSGHCEVVSGSGQIVRPFTKTLQPGEAVLIGHPNYLLYPQAQREVHGLSVYPEMNVDTGAFRLRQSFPVDLGGRTIRLMSGPLDLRLEARKTQIAWGPVVDGLRAGLGFQLDRSEYRVGETVGLNLFVENTTNEVKKLTRLTNGEPVFVECFSDGGARLDVRQTRTTLLPTDQTIVLQPHERAILSAPEIEIAMDSRAGAYPAAVLATGPGRVFLSTRDITDFRRPDDPPRTPLGSGRLQLTILPK